MSSGQIRNYISYIDVDSDESYINRISSLISEIEDAKEKQALEVEFTNKMNQINIIKKYREQKPKKEEVKPVVELQVEEDFPIEHKNNLEQLEEKLFLDEIYEDKLPTIEAPLYALLHIANSPLKLEKGLPVKDKKEAIKYNIPTKPIYDKVA